MLFADLLSLHLSTGFIHVIIHVITITVNIAPLLLEQIGLGPGALMIFLVYYFKWLLN